MSTENELRDFECFFTIQEMKDRSRDLYDKWVNLVKEYRDVLDNGSYVSDKGYTPHDFSHHCKNIYHNLSILLSGYKNYFNEEELFILNIAVILHDIYMAFDPSKRETHSFEAKEYIIKQVYTVPQSVMARNISKQQAMAIGLVVLGHSNLKSKESEENTINIVLRDGKNVQGGGGKVLKIPALAALLRLADELDITSKRIEGTRRPEHKINEDSIEYWENCNLFSEVNLDSTSNKIINLVVDDNFIAVHNEKGNDTINIRKIALKIQRELDMINEFVLNRRDLFSNWTFDKINISSADEEMQQMITQIDKVDPIETDGLKEEIKKKQKSII